MKPPNSALPPDALPQADRISEFRLVRYFTATSLVAFVVVAAVLGYVFRQFSINGLLRAQEEANVNLTRVFSNDLWRNDFGPFVRAMEGKPPAELKAAPQIPQLHRKVLALMRGSSTFKVKVYDMKGMTVYSTELKQIGEDKSGNLGVIAAWQGATTSELVHRNTFSALEGEVQNRDLIQSYIPQNDPETGKVIGVFEVYSDVTSLLGEIGEKQWYVMGAVFGMMALLYAALFLIVNFAQRIMDQQRQAHDRAEEALRNSELSRSKSQFLAAAAHELRTPMTSIFGFSELLRTRNFDRATELDVVESIHNEAGRLVHLLNKLLDLSRIEERAGKAFDFELQPLVPIIETSIAELLVPGDGRKVQTDIDQHLPPLLLDRDKIKQAMINILSNAYKYSPRDTSIELKVFRDSASGRQRVGVRITDHGMGMSAAEQAHVFERFWRADNAKAVPGSGLGMALVKEIISFHQGTIEIRSEPGAGTQVTLWFPADEQREEAIAC